MPYYSVAKGRNAGVYTSWDECKANTNGYSGAVFKKFSTQAEASAFAAQNSGSSGSSGSYGGGGSTSSYGGRGSSSSGSSSYGGGSSSYGSSSYGSGRSSSSSSYGGGSSSYGSSSYGGGGSSSYGGGSYSSSSGSKAPASSSNSHKVYVDGASRGNGKFATPDSGYGVYYGKNDARNSSVPLSRVDDVRETTPTNQRAELHAIKHALRDIASEAESGSNPKHYTIMSDSQYAQKAVNEWSHNWQKNNWRTSNGAPVANRDIIEDCLDSVSKINKVYKSNGQEPIKFEHVRGHAGDVGNEAADALANEGADLMRHY